MAAHLIVSKTLWLSGQAYANTYRHDGDSDTYLNFPAANQLSLVGGGATIVKAYQIAGAYGVLEMHGSGSATYPNFTFNGDSNTGMYRATTDTLAFTTAGSERMRIDSTGKIAVGTTTVNSNQMVIEGGTAAANGSSLAIKTGGGANSRVADLAFYGTFVSPSSDNGQRRTADITSGFSTANWGNEYLAFHAGYGSANDAANITAERMRITGDGFVGINEASPSVLLHVVGTGDLIRAGADSQQISIGVNTGGGENYIYGSNHPIKFGINGTERLRITSAGAVGINDSSPDRTLHVNSGGTNVVAKFESTDTTAAIEFTDNAGSAEIGGVGNDVVFFPAGTERMRITSAGLVGNWCFKPCYKS